MSANTLDCVVVGYNDVDLQSVMDSRESTKHLSGGYRWMLGNVVRFRGKWLSYMDFLNAVVSESSGRMCRLHTMELPNLGVCYLTSYLRKRGFEVEFVNFFNDGKERLAELVGQRPRAVAITTTFYVDNGPVAEMVRFVRRHSPDTRVIVGGPHVYNVCGKPDVTTVDYLLRDMGADIYVHESQGEQTLARVLTELRKGKGQNLDGVPNLVHRSTQEAPVHPALSLFGNRPPALGQAAPYLRTPREVERNTMDDNVVDWSLFPRALYTPTVQTRTARSCGFACSFCRYPVVAGPLTLTSLGAVETELRQMHEAGVRNVVFIDDTFNVPLPRFKKMLRMMIANRFDFNWFSYFRCSNSDDEAFDLMKASGCRGVFLGIESGDQQILNNMNKFADIDKYKYGIRGLNERGIITYVSLVIGFPGETRASVQNTIDFMNETRPTFYKAELYFHDENVPIHERAAEFGLVGSAYSWRHNTMHWQETSDLIEVMHQEIRNSVVFPPYMFDFWSIPYLMGKGISVEHIREFVRLAEPVLFRNSGHGPLRDEAALERHYGEMFALGKEIAEDLEAAGSRALPCVV